MYFIVAVMNKNYGACIVNRLICLTLFGVQSFSNIYKTLLRITKVNMWDEHSSL